MECYRKWRWVSKEGLVRYRRCGEAEAHHRYHGDRTLFTSERPLICATSQRGFKYSHSSLFTAHASHITISRQNGAFSNYPRP